MQHQNIQGKTAIVTGSGQNIGRCIARTLAAAGARVIVNGHRNKAAVEETIETIKEAGGGAHGIMADVSKPDEVKALVEETSSVFGPPDIVVNNVGRRLRQSFEDISIDDWLDILNINLNSVFYMCHHVLPMMRERAWGRVINISGYDGFTGHFSERAHNVTAKAGMHGLTKAIAREYGVHNVTANTVAPGAIQTVRDMKQYAHVDVDHVMKQLAIKHAGDVDDIAQACLYLAGDSGKFVTGQVIHVNGGEYMF